MPYIFNMYAETCPSFRSAPPMRHHDFLSDSEIRTRQILQSLNRGQIIPLHIGSLLTVDVKDSTGTRGLIEVAKWQMFADSYRVTTDQKIKIKFDCPIERALEMVDNQYKIITTCHPLRF